MTSTELLTQGVVRLLTSILKLYLRIFRYCLRLPHMLRVDGVEPVSLCHYVSRSGCAEQWKWSRVWIFRQSLYNILRI